MKSKFLQMVASSALMLAACGSEGGDKSIGPTPVVNSNSNWLLPCSDDVPCAEGSCFCGACTRVCMAASDCGNERPDAICVTPEAQSLMEQCAGVAPAESVCLPGCESDEDCSSWQACLAGNCVTTVSAREPEVDDMDEVRPCPLDDGVYCGSEVRLDEAGLYQCNERGITLLTRCESGCTVIERGDDVCTERLPSR